MLTTKQFAQQTLHPISVNRKPLNLPGNNKTKTGISKVIWPGKNPEKLAVVRTSEPENRRKILCIVQPVTFRKKTNNTDPKINET